MLRVLELKPRMLELVASKIADSTAFDPFRRRVIGFWSRRMLGTMWRQWKSTAMEVACAELTLTLTLTLT